ncbi:unnamed protein product [Meganyctiphanes norvegica]|uniref:Uncharacterized protein n=1 Tax=Meganyctiphanes norvegica TaxID=48144 RepID=A0AAV2RI26_MEGNR
MAENMESEEQTGLSIGSNDSGRLRGLKEGLNHTVEKHMRCWKASLFTKCFPSLCRENDAILEEIRTAMVANARKNIYEELAGLLNEGVSDSLEELGGLLKSYSGNQNEKAWRPSGDVEEDILAHDVKILMYEKQRLIESVDKQAKITEELIRKVKVGRKQCQKSDLELEKRRKTINEVEEVTSQIPVEPITKILGNF